MASVTWASKGVTRPQIDVSSLLIHREVVVFACVVRELLELVCSTLRFQTFHVCRAQLLVRELRREVLHVVHRV